MSTRVKFPSRHLLLISSLLFAALLVILTLVYHFQLIPHTSYPDSHFQIETYHSPFDHDQDGIDDQTDLLKSARAYLDTNPKYQSKYYASGYPDDNYGVCTDVIAFALLGAGYDLQQLLHADLTTHPEAYNIPNPDQNIDFRRTPNLETFFSRHAQVLTISLDHPSDWQAGDLVTFDHTHIAILSDRRNGRGLPFLLHHYSPFQLRYEEDSLSTYGKITGHYRLKPITIDQPANPEINQTPITTP